MLKRQTLTKSLITQVPPKCVYLRQAEIVAKESKFMKKCMKFTSTHERQFAKALKKCKITS